MPKGKRKLNLKEVLAAIDTNDFGFYDRLDEEERKEISPWVLMRFMSSCSGPREYSEYHLMVTNDVVNKEFSLMKDHPKLQWLLLACCGSGKKQFHPWIPPGKGMKKDKLQEFVSSVYPHYKLDEIDDFIRLNEKEDLVELAEQFGYTKKEIKDLFK